MEDSINGEVYKITNKINGKGYVGITKIGSKKRFNNHMSIYASGAPALARAVKKYGRENFTWELLDVANNIEDLSEKEMFYIKKHQTDNPNHGYNILKGGYCNEKATEARKVKIVREKTGEIFDSILSASEITKIPHYLISFVLQGRQKTANGEVFRYLEEYKHQETISKLKLKPVKIRCPITDIRTGIKYESIAEASRKTKIPRSTIGRCLRKTNKLSKVNYFIYADKQL